MSRQPWSMVNEWPRSANSVSSVVASECRYCLYVDLPAGSSSGTPSVVCLPRSYSAAATPSVGWDRRCADQGSAGVQPQAVNEHHGRADFSHLCSSMGVGTGARMATW